MKFLLDDITTQEENPANTRTNCSLGWVGRFSAANPLFLCLWAFGEYRLKACA